MDKTYIFSGPGRTEISGNHTDHQHGCVLAGAVNLETTAEVRFNGTETIRVISEGYPKVEIEINDLYPRREEYNTTAALVRGIAAAFDKLGAELKGIDAIVHSNVLPGSGLSSSAAFEVLFGTVFNELFYDSGLSAVEIAQIGQYAENVYFGKPSGLMDQMASSVGGMVFIDFEDPSVPTVEKINFDFNEAGYALCIIDSGADHADLTDEYTSVTKELAEICAFFGKKFLREIPEKEFVNSISALRGEVPDRAILRAIHIYDENRRVLEQVDALKTNDIDRFLKLVNESGQSSWMYMQNITPTGEVVHQDVAVALSVCKLLLDGKGAFRVHGGGFAGTVQAFVPIDMLEEFKTNVEKIIGKGKCYVMSIRSEGGIRIQ